MFCFFYFGLVWQYDSNSAGKRIISNGDLWIRFVIDNEDQDFQSRKLEVFANLLNL